MIDIQFIITDSEPGKKNISNTSHYIHNIIISTNDNMKIINKVFYILFVQSLQKSGLYPVLIVHLNLNWPRFQVYLATIM